MSLSFWARMCSYLVCESVRREMCVCVYSANALACFFWGWRLHAVAADVLETYTPLITASPHRSPGCLTFLDSDGQQRRRPRVLRLFHSSKTKGLPRGSLMRTQAPSRFHPALFIAGKPPRTAVGEAGRRPFGCGRLGTATLLAKAEFVCFPLCPFIPHEHRH